MWLDAENTRQKRDLVLQRPLVNASGTLGFAPDVRSSVPLQHLGAFITNPISSRPRVPAANRACLYFPGGFLLHTGHPNPGFKSTLRRYKRRWATAELPIIIHLLVESPDSLAEMVRELEGLENILAVELGLPPDCDAEMLARVIKASLGELPIIPCVSPEQVPTLLAGLVECQPAAVHLVEPRGTLPGGAGTLVSGRLFGPAIFPAMLRSAQVLVQAGLSVIANGGVVDRWQVEVLLTEGVLAVGLGSVMWQMMGFPVDQP